VSGTATTIHNERVKLLATILNNAGLASSWPPSSRRHLDLGWHIVTILAWVGFGVGLHFSARAVLGRLR
jgi:hypothetical protein